MLLKSYTKNIFRSDCNHYFENVHCIAGLDSDVGPVIPYLNAILGGSDFSKDPPSVTFQAHGRLITVESRQIAVNALKDEQEADKILEWLKREINQAWADRDNIEPSYGVLEKPLLIEIFKLLPKTNCGECGRPTCMVFASEAVIGVLGAENCPALESDKRAGLTAYLSRFKFE